MLKRVSALILSAATLVACSESIAPSGSATQAPTSGREVLAELTCKADVGAQRISCAPTTPSLAGGASADFILGGQNLYTKLTSTNVVANATTISADVTVQNLTVQPWATTDGTTATGTGVRVFFHTLPSNGVTVANADGTGTFTGSNQPYFQYSGATLGADQILSSNEVSSSKNWQFTLNGASSFTFQVLVTSQMPDEPGVLRWTPSTVTQFGSFETINAVWGASASDVWVGGSNGPNALQHWNGSGWTSYTGAETSDIAALWGSSSSDVYAVGGTKIQHWNGSAWADTTSASNPLLAIWGSSATDVYAGGLSGTLVHSSGGAFSSVSGTGIGVENVSAIWGSSSSDVYVGATNVYHYNGSTWSTVSTGLGVDVRAIWGSSASDVWIGGLSGKMVHYNGTSWSSVTTLGTADVSGIWGTSSSDVYMVNRGGQVWHYNGSTWVSYTIPSSGLLGVWGSGRTDVWAVGTDNTFTYNRAYHGTH